MCFENGQTDISFYEIKNWSAQNFDPEYETDSRGFYTSSLKNFPNPSNSTLFFDIEVFEDNNLEINLVPLVGSKINLIKHPIIEKGKHNFNANIESFVSGYYLIETKIGINSSITPIIFAK